MKNYLIFVLKFSSIQTFLLLEYKTSFISKFLTMKIYLKVGSKHDLQRTVLIYNLWDVGIGGFIFSLEEMYNFHIF